MESSGVFEKNNCSQNPRDLALSKMFNAFIIFRMSDLYIEEMHVPEYVKITEDIHYADQIAKLFFENSIHESQKLIAEKLYDFSSLAQKLEKYGTITANFSRSVHGWIETTMGVLDKTSDGNIDHVLFCSRTINKQKAMEETFATFHKLIGSGMWRVKLSTEGKFKSVEWSDDLRHMLGYNNKDDFPNKIDSWIMLLHPEDKSNVLQKLNDAIQNYKDGEFYNQEYRLRTKDRGYRWFRAAGDIVRRPDNTACLFYGIFLDITEQKEGNELLKSRNNALSNANKALEAIDSIHEALDSGSWTVDFDFANTIVSVYWSNKFKQMLGFRPEEMPDTVEAFMSRVHPSDKDVSNEEFSRTVSDFTGKHIYSIEFRLLTKQNKYRWFKSAGRIVRRKDGSAERLYGVLLDIDDSKKAKEELHNALIAAESANRAKSAFLFNMSHDIRTPMNAIIGFTELMERHIDDKVQLQEYLKKMKSSNEFMLSLLNNVLEMSRIESGKVTLDLEVSDQNKLYDSIISVFETRLKQKHIKLECKVHNVTHKKVWYDTTKMRQIFLNILSNAVKYTPEGGRITLDFYECQSEKPGYATFQIEVTDTGIGMSKDFIPHIFEEFSREKNSTEEGNIGTGLGMPIVKKLIDMMGGKIFVESELNVGTKFTVIFNFRIAEEVREPEPAELGDDVLEFTLPEARRILLVEDNDLNAEIAIEVLKEEKFDIDRAIDGIDCLEKFKSHPADYYKMILMDIQMPRMNGYEASKKIRQMEGAYADIPIIAMTANAFDTDKKNAMEAGMSAHIAKPINIEKLIMVIGKFLC